MNDTAIRNKKAFHFVEESLLAAKSFDPSKTKSLPDLQEIENTLHDLIFVKAKGFRGLVVTALTGMYLDQNYSPLTDFYGCNPRSIFENGIYYALKDTVPCGKSDPLNVAKNEHSLNENWARGKRPPTAAKAAVDFLTLIMDAGSERKQILIDLFFRRLLDYGESITTYKITVPKSDGLSTNSLTNLLIEFVLQYPESGTVPQKIVGLILRHTYSESKFSVEGVNESVFGTNTTSKKPADLWLSIEQKPAVLLEITLKKVDEKRLRDALESIHQMNIVELPITFICRVPEDTSSLKIVNGRSLIDEKEFNFVDIREFIRSTVSLLDTPSQLGLLQEISDFVKSVERPIKTKQGWNELLHRWQDQ